MRGGKRMHVVLLHEAARLVTGEPVEGLDSAAPSIEVLQTHALVHDDLIDDSPTRRGGPSAYYACRERFPNHPRAAPLDPFRRLLRRRGLEPLVRHRPVPLVDPGTGHERGSVPDCSADDVDEAVALANETSFGLGGVVFSADPAAAQAVAERMDTGSVGVNFFGANHNASFGGRHDSGLVIDTASRACPSTSPSNRFTGASGDVRRRPAADDFVGTRSRASQPVDANGPPPADRPRRCSVPGRAPPLQRVQPPSARSTANFPVSARSASAARSAESGRTHT